MLIGIISDIHDNVWRLERALDSLRGGAEALLVCGDLCSPFVVHQLGRGFPGPIHVVFGNNDGDLYRITANARAYPHIHLHGELFRGELGGRKIAMNHYPDIARGLARSGEYALVCFGHNHRHEISDAGAVVLANPGPVMGAAIEPDGSWRDVAATFVLYDSDTGKTKTEIIGA